MNREIQTAFDKINTRLEHLDRLLKNHTANHTHVYAKEQSRTIQERGAMIKRIQEKESDYQKALEEKNYWEKRAMVMEENYTLSQERVKMHVKKIAELSEEINGHQTGPFITISKATFEGWREQIDKLTSIETIIKEGK